MTMNYLDILSRIDADTEEHLMGSRKSWEEGKIEWINGLEIWTPVCILKENSEIKYQNADGVTTPYIPSEEDKRATDWFII